MNYFVPKEFACKDGSPSPFGKWNVTPAVVDLANLIREACGFPLVCSSGYRSPEHNESVGGVKSSLHCQGLACDLQVGKCSSEDEKKARLEALWNHANRLNPKGGVGYYRWGVHVDARGVKARWDYR